MRVTGYIERASFVIPLSLSMFLHLLKLPFPFRLIHGISPLTGRIASEGSNDTGFCVFTVWWSTPDTKQAVFASEGRESCL